MKHKGGGIAEHFHLARSAPEDFRLSRQYGQAEDKQREDPEEVRRAKAAAERIRADDILRVVSTMRAQFGGHVTKIDEIATH